MAINFEIEDNDTLSVRLEGATVVAGVDSVNGKTGTVVLNANDVGAYSKAEDDAKFVAKVDGKGLSTNDYDDTEKGKVATALQPADLTPYRTSEAQDLIDNTKYVKPATGVPKTDLASDVQTSLGKADTALQEHQSLSEYRKASAQDEIDNGKVDKVAGKGLSTNDYDNTEKGKVASAVSHMADKTNPHEVTKAQVGLGNVPNTNFTDRVEALEDKTALSDFIDDLGSSPSHTHSQYALITEAGYKLDLELNSSTYVITPKLYDKNNTLISTGATVDLPLESVVVSGSYDAQTKKVILTLKNGSTIEFSVADLISGLASEADLTAHEEDSSIHVTAVKQATWNAKYDKPSGGIPDSDLAEDHYTEDEADAKFVAKETGKGLSTNDYDATEKQKVADAYGNRHSHSNKALLDTYTQTEADLDDAVEKKHAHSNKAVLDDISDEDITSWNGKSVVSVSESGSATDRVKYITVDGVQKKIGGEEDFKVTLTDEGEYLSSDKTFQEIKAAYDAGRFIYLVDEEGLTAFLEYVSSQTASFVNHHLNENAHVTYEVSDIGSGTTVDKYTERFAMSSALTSHTNNTSNPHGVTKSQVGLGNVPNTDFTDTISGIESDIDDIEGLIPAQASSSNQLADKSFVNSSIATSTATFRGTVNTSSDTEADAQAALSTITNMDDNDYAFVNAQGCGTGGSDKYKRYKYNGTAWSFEYVVNNSGFTASQWSAINSGIVANDVTKIGTALQPSDIVDALNDTSTNKALSANKGKVLNDAISTLIDYGSNSDGEYWKFSSGLLICKKIGDYAPVTPISSWGSIYYTEFDIGNYPYPFMANYIPYINHNVIGGDASAWMGSYGLNTTTNTSWGRSSIFRATTRTISTEKICSIAIGRWK